MRVGTVIGRVTLSKAAPQLTGGRWLIVSPLTADHYQHRPYPPTSLSPEFAPVVYDNLGGGLGDTIGYIEGREAAVPFDEPTPIDAIAAAIVDELFHSPLK
jgi:microcompartment protein CcmK/EutM